MDKINRNKNPAFKAMGIMAHPKYAKQLKAKRTKAQVVKENFGTIRRRLWNYAEIAKKYDQYEDPPQKAAAVPEVFNYRPLPKLPTKKAKKTKAKEVRISSPYDILKPTFTEVPSDPNKPQNKLGFEIHVVKPDEFYY